MNSHFIKGNVWVEITKIKPEHGISGWEFGTCLWVPSRTRNGHDRYSLMRKPQKGDLVLHFYKNYWEDGVYEMRLSGSSIVANSYKEVTNGPQVLGGWSDHNSYYKIDLLDYEQFYAPISLNSIISHFGSEIRNELIEFKPLYYPFSTYGDSIRTVQGIYLAQCTSNLYLILKNAVKLYQTNVKYQNNNPIFHDSGFEYAEVLKNSREKYFFCRNKKLVEDAKKYYGYTCCICKFNFEERYGDIGKGYIECHHINPLSERPESEWTTEIITTIEDVRVVCANCHRIIHSKRPALSINQVLNALKQNKCQNL